MTAPKLTQAEHAELRRQRDRAMEDLRHEAERLDDGDLDSCMKVLGAAGRYREANRRMRERRPLAVPAPTANDNEGAGDLEGGHGEGDR